MFYILKKKAKELFGNSKPPKLNEDSATFYRSPIADCQKYGPFWGSPNSRTISRIRDTRRDPYSGSMVRNLERRAYETLYSVLSPYRGQNANRDSTSLVKKGTPKQFHAMALRTRTDLTSHRSTLEYVVHLLTQCGHPQRNPSLHSSNIITPKCYTNLTKWILKNAPHCENKHQKPKFQPSTLQNT